MENSQKCDESFSLVDSNRYKQIHSNSIVQMIILLFMADAHIKIPFSVVHKL